MINEIKPTQDNNRIIAEMLKDQILTAMNKKKAYNDNYADDLINNLGDLRIK